MSHVNTIKTCGTKRRGTFNDACERAIRWANARQSGDVLDDCERFLFRAGWLSETFGREFIECNGAELEYLNVGETYTLTIGSDDDGHTAQSLSYGAWIEEQQQIAHYDDNLTTCGYCGKFTELDCDDWRDVTCSSCGRNVSTGELPVTDSDNDADDDIDD